MIPTFIPPVPPSPGTTNKPEFRVLEADFGEYAQAAGDGINSVRDVLSLEWATLHPTQAAAITEFLRGLKGTGLFWYTPSDEAKARKWTCKDYSDRRGEGGLRTVTATFRQSFNLST